MTRLVLKLLLKASLPLALLVGTMSYGMYLRGGDPAGLLRSVGSGIGERIKRLAGDATDGARRGVAQAGAAFDGAPDPVGTAVFTWIDADGVTHFSSSNPEGVIATTIFADPNVNVLAPLPAGASEVPRSVGDATAGSSKTGVRGIHVPAAGTTGTTSADQPAGLPGVAGMLDVGNAPQMSARDAERLLRSLQGENPRR